MLTCDICGEKMALPYRCRYCGGTFCSRHRLPENHSCEGLRDLSERMRREGRIYLGTGRKPGGEPSEQMRVHIGRERPERQPERMRGRGTTGPFGGLFGLMKIFFLRHASLTLLLAMVLVGFVQLIAWGILGPGYYRMGDHGTFLYFLAASRSTVLSRPWTLVTSIFAHGGFFHLFINGILLFFLGPVLERRVGRKKFVLLFLGSGIVAGIAQLLSMSSNIVVLGASGGIFGVLGTLTVLSPRLPILLFFFVPMQLWMLTLGYGLIEAFLAFSGGGGPIAHMAHFTGLVVGLVYGYKLRRERRFVHPLEELIRGYY